MRLKRNRLVLAVVPVIFACCVSIRTGYLEDDQKAAEQAVERFHSRLSNERYDEIYADTTEDFRKTGDKADLISIMKRTHDQFGVFKTSSQTNSNVTMGVPRQVKLSYTTKYEKGDAAEEFLWLVNFEQVKLASYRVSSLPRE